jgi:hypothetical protein
MTQKYIRVDAPCLTYFPAALRIEDVTLRVFAVRWMLYGTEFPFTFSLEFGGVAQVVRATVS